MLKSRTLSNSIKGTVKRITQNIFDWKLIFIFTCASVELNFFNLNFNSNVKACRIKENSDTLIKGIAYHFLSCVMSKKDLKE